MLLVVSLVELLMLCNLIQQSCNKFYLHEGFMPFKIAIALNYISVTKQI